MFKKSNHGFLLEDALISVLIVSVICVIVSSAVLSHYHVEESVEMQCEQEKENAENFMSGIQACVICTEEDGEIKEESY